MSEQVALHIGPAPSAVVHEWVANRRQLVAVSREVAALRPRDDVLDLLDTFLDMWRIEADRSDTFDWTYQIDRDVLVLVGRYWLDLGELSPDERAALGAPLATPEVESFTLVVAAGMVAALREAGPRGHELLGRLGL